MLQNQRTKKQQEIETVKAKQRRLKSEQDKLKRKRKQLKNEQQQYTELDR